MLIISRWKYEVTKYARWLGFVAGNLFFIVYNNVYRVYQKIMKLIFVLTVHFVPFFEGMNLSLEILLL